LEMGVVGQDMTSQGTKKAVWTAGTLPITEEVVKQIENHHVKRKRDGELTKKSKTRRIGQVWTFS